LVEIVTIKIKMIITTEQLSQCTTFTDTNGELLNALNKFLQQYNITSVKDVASFIAQCSHESCDFKHLEENLNYSGDRLIAIWPKHFNESNADDYNRNPQKIANCVYANRMGNGTEDSGDGWLYRGRGAIQLTGKDNYQKFAEAIGMAIGDVVAYLSTIEGAIESACWYWTTKPKLDGFAQNGDILNETKLINGGTIGLEDRQKRYDKCLSILS
jgi:putative chitinase